jgi:hypothetical protein
MTSSTISSTTAKGSTRPPVSAAGSDPPAHSAALAAPCRHLLHPAATATPPASLQPQRKAGLTWQLWGCTGNVLPHSKRGSKTADRSQQQQQQQMEAEGLQGNAWPHLLHRQGRRSQLHRRAPLTAHQPAPMSCEGSQAGDVNRPVKGKGTDSMQGPQTATQAARTPLPL